MICKLDNKYKYMYWIEIEKSRRIDVKPFLNVTERRYTFIRALIKRKDIILALSDLEYSSYPINYDENQYVFLVDLDCRETLDLIKQVIL